MKIPEKDTVATIKINTGEEVVARIRDQDEGASRAVACSQNHAFRETKFHFAWRKIGHHHCQLTFELFRRIG